MQLETGHLLQRLKPLFDENFEKFGELGAAVSVWQNGKPIVDLYGGFCDAGRERPWTADTVVLVWSATKGIGSACVLHALQQRKIELNRPVAEFWPEFGQADKDKITLGQLLSHQAGLCALDQRVDVLDYDGVIRALEAQAPLWPPGTAHGYHARTFGFLLDELMRRDNWKNAVRLLAGKFCPAARTRFLDRLAGKGEFASGHDLCCQKRQAARAGRVLSRSCYARYVGEKDVYLALWIECHQQDE